MKILEQILDSEKLALPHNLGEFLNWCADDEALLAEWEDAYYAKHVHAEAIDIYRKDDATKRWSLFEHRVYVPRGYTMSHEELVEDFIQAYEAIEVHFLHPGPDNDAKRLQSLEGNAYRYHITPESIADEAGLSQDLDTMRNNYQDYGTLV